MKTIISSRNKLFINLFIFYILLFALFASSCSSDSEIVPNNPPITVTSIVPDYLNKVFTEIISENNIQYGSHPTFHTLDFYEAIGNNEINRPLVLLFPGGAFKSYTQVEELAEMSKDLALRGYASAVVKYSLGDVNKGETNLQGIHDQKSAIRYFRKNSSEFGIDPNNIFIGGLTISGSLSYVTAFFDESDIKNLTQEKIRIGTQYLIDQYGLEGNENLGYSSSVKGALIMNGWTNAGDFIQTGEPALMLIHHEKAHLSNGTHTLGRFTDDQGTILLGAQAIFDTQLNTTGYTEGSNLQYILMNTESNGSSFNPNYEPLIPDNYDAIATFFYNNLD